MSKYDWYWLSVAFTSVTFIPASSKLLFIISAIATLVSLDACTTSLKFIIFVL